MMKNIIRISYLLLLLYYYSPVLITQNYWIPLERPTQQNLNQVFFVDSLIGWVVGDSGTIYKTIDGGTHWLQQNVGTNKNIIDVFMVNKKHGWVIAHDLTPMSKTFGTKLYKTTNGGITWTNVPFESSNIIFFSVYFLDSLKGWLGGDYGTLLGTTDGGSNWFKARVDTEEYPRWPIRKIKFLSPQFGYCVGGIRDISAVIWRTTNGGELWNVHSIGSEPLYDVHFFDSLNAICVGGDFDWGAAIVRTTNAGNNWVYEFIGQFGIALAVSFRTTSEGWVPLDIASQYMFTQDFGQSWTAEYTPDSSNVCDVQFVDERNGFMIGNNGLVLKYAYKNSLNVYHRWNIVSIPATVADKRKSILFPTAISPAYTFTETGYIAVDTLSYGVGYWLKFPEDDEIEIIGATRHCDTIYVRAGWNLIGSITYPVPTRTIVSEPPNIISSGFFSYKNGYTSSDTIKPGMGYWIKVNNNGKLILNNTSVTR